MKTVTQASTRRRYIVAVLVALLVALGLYLSSLYSYVLFHTFAELFSIIVAFGIFMVTWNSRQFMNNSYLLLIGVAFVFIGSLDMLHTLAYKGMGVFQGYDTNLPTQLWIGARYVHSLSLLAAPLVLGRKLNIRFVFLGYGIATLLLVMSIFYWNNFPACFVEGAGLTPFKRISEYVISGILVGAAFLLYRKHVEFDKRMFQLLFVAVVVTIASELSFTIYAEPYGISNLIGHYFKIGAYYLTYKAIIETGLRKPYTIMFINLKQIEEKLTHSNAELEREVSQRKQAEVALRDALRKSIERQKEIAALLKSSRVILRHKDFKVSARSIFDYCKELIGATSGYVALLKEDKSGNEVLFLDPGGLPCSVDPSLPMPIRGLRAEAYRTAKTVYHNDFTNSELVKYLPQGHVELKNVLFAPMVIEGKAVGLLGLANKPGGFTESDAHVATGFGELAAIALRNSQTWESLEQSKERFSSVTQTATDAIIASDNLGNIILWNRGAENIFGYSSDEVIGKPTALLMPERLREAHRSAMRQAALRGKLKHAGKTLELTAISKDGSEFPIELSLATWQAGGEVFFAAVIRDITERKRLQEQLLSYERLATLGKIAGTISHELRNPLAAIDTSVFYLQTKKLKETDEKVQTHLNRIHASVLRSAAIIQALQDFTQLRAPHLIELDLRAVATEALLNTKIPATVQMVRNFPDVEAPVNADSEQLRKAFGNIITNAVQAMGDTGVLTVTIRFNTDEAEVSFADTGPGIPPENLKRLFEPLFSTKTWGIGFGLTIAKAIIDKHNGTIEAKSEVGKGATLIVRLPINKKS